MSLTCVYCCLHHSPTSVLSPPMAEDTASSLRAAALLSLKSKRRTAAPPALPRPTAPKSDAVILTYDDPPPAPSPAPAKKEKESGKVNVEIKNSADQADVDLEDGEISDENDNEDSVMKDGSTKALPSARAPPPSIGIPLPVKPSVCLHLFTIFRLSLLSSRRRVVCIFVLRTLVVSDASVSSKHLTHLHSDNSILRRAQILEPPVHYCLWYASFPWTPK